MSEDQIRVELSEIRTLQRESHAELSALITQLKDDVVAEVDERNRQSLSNFRWLIGLILVPILGMFSWIAIDHLDLKEKHKELKTDFGTVLKTTEYLHKDAVGYEELVGKYFLSRGAQPTN